MSASTNPNAGIRLVRHANGVYTGEIVCDYCGARADHIDHLDHASGCPERTTN